MIVNCVVRSTVNSFADKLKLNPCTTTAFADVGWLIEKNGTVVPAANGWFVVNVATLVVSALLLIDTVMAGKILSTSYSS